MIPTDTKVAYLGALLRTGFRSLDAVSFVSAKYVPQMADSEAVMEKLNSLEPALRGAEIIGIVVNEKGFQRALATPGVTAIGYPYSVSERFSRQNANMSREESRRLVEKMHRDIQARARLPGIAAPNLVIYVSMAFGNPYGEPWLPEMVTETVQWLQRLGVSAVSLADTAGTARAEDVGKLFAAVKGSADGMEIGLHLHSRPEGAAEKVLAAYEAGCRRFDSALTGLGGCPFAGDELVGNIPTEIVVSTLANRGVSTGIEPAALAGAVKAAQEIRNLYAH